MAPFGIPGDPTAVDRQRAPRAPRPKRRLPGTQRPRQIFQAEKPFQGKTNQRAPAPFLIVTRPKIRLVKKQLYFL